MPATTIATGVPDSRNQETKSEGGPRSWSVPPPVPVLGPGAKVEQYQIVKLLGRGGMGCVYEAWDERLRRKVALKVLLPHLTCDEESLARFLREGRAAAAVAHENIVTVYDAGQDGATAYLAMQFLQGVSLHQYITAKGVPPLPAAVRIAREVAAGLASAHAVGLLHRDIKPGNILLEAPKGRVKLLDFGLATPFAAGDTKLTQTGLVVGTPAYMSPEQARAWKTDHRSDLFSLGVVLYQMCAGQLPFTGPDTMAVLTALAVDAPVPVGRLNPKVPLRLELLIDRLLDKDPAGRPQSAGELVADLRSVERELVTRPTVRVLTAEVVTVPAAAPVAAPEHTTEVAIEYDPPTPKSRKRHRTKSRLTSRKAQRARNAQERRVFLAVLVVGIVLVVGVLTAVGVVVFGRKPAGTTGSPPSRETTPTAAKAEEGERFHPRDLPPGWPPGKPLPPGWRPGDPLPPEHRQPGPPPPPPRK